MFYLHILLLILLSLMLLFVPNCSDTNHQCEKNRPLIPHLLIFPINFVFSRVNNFTSIVGSHYLNCSNICQLEIGSKFIFGLQLNYTDLLKSNNIGNGRTRSWQRTILCRTQFKTIYFSYIYLSSCNNAFY